MDKEMEKLVEKEFIEPAQRYIARLLEKVPREHRVEALVWLQSVVKDMSGNAWTEDARHAQAIKEAAQK